MCSMAMIVSASASIFLYHGWDGFDSPTLCFDQLVVPVDPSVHHGYPYPCPPPVLRVRYLCGFVELADHVRNLFPLGH